MIEGLRIVLGRELDALSREVELFPDDESLWKTAPGITNSAGNLVLHVCGNLRDFVGRVLGGLAYQRNRDAEFGRRTGSRQELAGEIRAARQVVDDVLPGVDAARLTELFPEPVGGHRVRTDMFLLHLSAHLAFHLGQVGYVRRMVTGENRSSAPLPLSALVGKP
jgi:hypothetical protein